METLTVVQNNGGNYTRHLDPVICCRYTASQLRQSHKNCGGHRTVSENFVRSKWMKKVLWSLIRNFLARSDQEKNLNSYKSNIGADYFWQKMSILSNFYFLKSGQILGILWLGEVFGSNPEPNGCRSGRTLTQNKSHSGSTTLKKKVLTIFQT